MKTPTRHVSALVGITVALSLTLAASSHAALVVVNESFEAYDSGTGSGDPTTYPYPKVTGWTYAGTPLTANLVAAIDETTPSAPDTPHGANWLLVDSRAGTEHVYQAVGTISLGDALTLSALLGSHATVGLSDFELGLYRSDAGSGTPDVLLAAIVRSDSTLVAGNLTETLTANYTASAADAGETLFVRAGLLSSQPVGAGVTQVYIDNVTVVPEPSAVALLGLGGLGLVFRRRRAGA